VWLYVTKHVSPNKSEKPDRECDVLYTWIKLASPGKSVEAYGKCGTWWKHVSLDKSEDWTEHVSQDQSLEVDFLAW
jgi:hypothetical protein